MLMKVSYAIESLNSTYRKLNRQRSVFPSDTALLKALYLATFEATKNGPCQYGTGGRYMGNWASCTKAGCQSKRYLTKACGNPAPYLTCPASAVIYEPRAESSQISLQPSNYHRRSVFTEIFSQARKFCFCPQNLQYIAPSGSSFWQRIHFMNLQHLSNYLSTS